MMPRPDMARLAAEWLEPRFRDGAECYEEELRASLVTLLEQVEHNALERAVKASEKARRDVDGGDRTVVAYRLGVDRCAWRIRQLKRGGRP